jgi:peptidylprolyl isomerase
MKKAQSGDTVRVHYTGKLEDGTVFDSSREREPLEFTLGGGKLIKGFENAVEGMSAGESSAVRIPAAEAYGLRREELVLNIPRDKFPPAIEAREGVMLSLRQPDGGMLEAEITKVEEQSVTIDANHPLAGKDLIFDIELLELA